MPTEWTYRVDKLIRAIDGDSLILRVSRDVDFGFRRALAISSVEEFRLLGIDTPERKGPTKRLGDLAAEALRSWFMRMDGGEMNLDGMLLHSLAEDDKYGRWLARIDADGTDISEWMIRKGYALPYSGKGPRPQWNPAAAYPLIAA